MGTGGFLKRLLGRASAESAPAESELPTTQPVPHVIEPASLQDYRLGEEIGRGAMAVVYKATHLPSRRQVAVKRLALQREFAAEDLADVKQRFMREASAARHLQHPDILQVLEAGQTPDGHDTWIAMEYVLGRDLSHHTRPGQLLPVGEALKLGARLARALHYAHSQGVVHRDIKPANVMLDRVGNALKIMDFGIARMADGSRTRTGLVLGTPSYMSPEQLAGLPVDGRSDLYSLGVMLYQLLTGRLPHQSDSMAQLMYQIANQPAPDVRHLRAELPESLALVLALALEKRPELRYQSGEQLAQDLEAVLAQLDPALAASSGPAGNPPNVGESAAFADTLRLRPQDPGQNEPPSSDEPPRTT
ncbi:serine/threonine protein kinase [Pelomonas sp. CA6]|uniref:serine/threonine-protein kinase n=1 Tax=Pelomonas sp. CA6 TaxID=2907999 RepID=UPI001F4BEE58|nr:serine/threonine-protein kinase [Pelomonas sp. CA6]MCH7343622.1 serine/threonine protein kinase [Pelomonas sp. CA6]